MKEHAWDGGTNAGFFARGTKGQKVIVVHVDSEKCLNFKCFANVQIGGKSGDYY
jgi:hypothetical protein